MKSKSCCNLAKQAQATDWKRFAVAFAVGVFVLSVPLVARADAPSWMHALVSVPVPAHDEKTNAVLLYEEQNVNVISTDKIKTRVRRAYKILRPDGRDYGTVIVHFASPGQKINGLQGWCIPATGKDYEVKAKEGAEISLPKVEGSELITDVKAKLIAIPAPDPGNIVGYEYELEEQPLVLQDGWSFQRDIPVRESHYQLQLPSGWEYKARLLNYGDVKPEQAGTNAWRWSVADVKPIREEEQMPPLPGIAGEMIVSFFPPGGAPGKAFSNWQEMGIWYKGLTSGRLDASPEIKQKVAALTSSSPTSVAKMRALASFVQHDIRYVAIELGIGGYQPHSAADVFAHHYGDCKDKAGLLSAMLHEIGVDSYYVVINSERGSVASDTPANVEAFDHAILAIKLPEEIKDTSLVAALQHPRLGKILFFDPTNELTPFGEIGGYLQANYGLLVTPEGGELVQLPIQVAGMNGIRRTGKLTLDSAGNVRGDIEEIRVGDRAWSQRWALRTVSKDADRIKPIENLLSSSLSNYVITKALVENLDVTDQPFGFKYSFEARNYAKNAGDLLLVRPRVLGVKTSAILETKAARQFPIEFEGPVIDTDSFEITLPAGFEVDDLPPPVDADFSFASYHSKTEAKGNVIAYTRTFEVKELSVPVSKAEELKKFYRIIASDERNTAVLKTAK
jgi:Domain of Unknown Function with PDB structure (DUF3857)/Transglutaminase-like superfamily